MTADSHYRTRRRKRVPVLRRQPHALFAPNSSVSFGSFHQRELGGDIPARFCLLPDAAFGAERSGGWKDEMWWPDCQRSVRWLTHDRRPKEL